MMSSLIPTPNVTLNDSPEEFAQILLDLYLAASNVKPVEITTETSGPAVLQACRLTAIGVVYATIRFDLSEPSQELWYQVCNRVIKVQDADFVMYGRSIEQTWRQMASNVTTQMFTDALTELKLKMTLLASRSMYTKLQSARSLLA